MKRSIAFSTLILVIGLGAGISAAQTKSAAKPAIFAQKLVDEALVKHPEVVIIAMHVTPPGKTDNVVIASNIGRYGKKADEDDMRVIDTGKSNLEINKARQSLRGGACPAGSVRKDNWSCRHCFQLQARRRQGSNGEDR